MGQLYFGKPRRRRYERIRIVVMAVIFLFGYLGIFVIVQSLRKDVLEEPPGCSRGESDQRFLQRKLLQVTNLSAIVSSNISNTSEPSPIIDDVFTMEQLRKGAVTLHVIGVIYMFVSLAIVCDEFFVPALELIAIKLNISADVAGATFMAAGGSAPELFTNFIGTFFVRSDVGIGTIVGSAVFNILFVIGMCAMVSKDVLRLTWWPLFRDVTFYSISLIFLIVFFLDQYIYWWESLVLLCCYAAYVIFMKFNRTIERFIKSKTIRRNQVASTMPSTENLIFEDQRRERSSSLPISGSKFRHGVLQLMIHTIDPLGEVPHLKNGTVATISNGQLHHGDRASSRNTNTLTTHTTMAYTTPGSVTSCSADGHATLTPPSPLQAPPPHIQINDSNTTAALEANGRRETLPDPSNRVMELDEETEPLDISWPETGRKRLTYILIAPILFPVWLTLPDVRKPAKRKFFVWTFFGSIMWIAVLSYLMNRWAATIGKTIGITDAVLGLTFLAAGTSIPDLITSVIVAKKGFGDMAVSSSVGSNIFDVTVGLPMPWLLYSAINMLPFAVSSDGLFCSIFLLFLMLISVIIMIGAFRWRMNKPMGAAMFVFYIIFVTISLLLEFKIIHCPTIS